MRTVPQTKMHSVAGFLDRVVDRVFGTAAPPPPERKMQNLAQKQAHIRAVSVRQGFQTIRARSDEMAQCLAAFKHRQEKHGTVPAASIDPVEEVETIVLSSGEPRSDSALA